jgi:hypothetical protein
VEKYEKLSTDPKFEEEFMVFFEESILDFKDKKISAIELDNRISEFVDKYVKVKRNKNINSILRKK